MLSAARQRLLGDNTGVIFDVRRRGYLTAELGYIERTAHLFQSLRVWPAALLTQGYPPVSD